VASVLPRITGGAPLLSQSLRVDRGEGDIAAILSQLAEDFPDLSIGCYPFQRDGIFGANVVVRGSDGARVDAAVTRLSKDLAQ
ncbi:competence/damage-inducible protein A, partial [Cribrihabitans sp. XS_ASV171]